LGQPLHKISAVFAGEVLDVVFTLNIPEAVAESIASARGETTTSQGGSMLPVIIGILALLAAAFVLITKRRTDRAE